MKSSKIFQLFMPIDELIAHLFIDRIQTER